jgi:hypothetical protein
VAGGEPGAQRKADVLNRGYSGYNTCWALPMLATLFPPVRLRATIVLRESGGGHTNGLVHLPPETPRSIRNFFIALPLPELTAPGAMRGELQEAARGCPAPSLVTVFFGANDSVVAGCGGVHPVPAPPERKR